MTYLELLKCIWSVIDEHQGMDRLRVKWVIYLRTLRWHHQMHHYHRSIMAYQSNSYYVRISKLQSLCTAIKVESNFCSIYWFIHTKSEKKKYYGRNIFEFQCTKHFSSIFTEHAKIEITRYCFWNEYYVIS